MKSLESKIMFRVLPTLKRPETTERLQLSIYCSPNPFTSYSHNRIPVWRTWVRSSRCPCPPTLLALGGECTHRTAALAWPSKPGPRVAQKGRHLVLRRLVGTSGEETVPAVMTSTVHEPDLVHRLLPEVAACRVW